MIPEIKIIINRVRAIKECLNKNLSNFIKVRGKATTKSNNKLDIFFYFLPFKNDTISIMFLCYKGCSDMEMGLLNMIETIK